MLIPVRCYSCGKVIGHLYEFYQELLEEDYTEAEALNALQLDRICCRRMILSHIDLAEDLLPYSVPVVGTMPLVNALQTPTPHRNPSAPTIRSLTEAHQRRRAALHASTQELWESAQQHAQSACDAIAQDANTAVAAAFEREKRIETELKGITARTEHMRRQMVEWATLFAKINTELKTMGDVSNWAQRMEEDLVETVNVLEELSERKRRAQGMQ